MSVTIMLVGLFITAQLVADVSAVKLVEVFGLSIPAGTFIYATTFTLRDIIHRKVGKHAARASIIVAAVANIVLAGYFMLAIWLPHPEWWQAQEAFKMILGAVPHIVISSIVAEVFAGLVDTEVYDIVMRKLGLDAHYAGVVLSNLCSVPLDSLVFGALAFVVCPALFGVGHVMPLSALWTLVAGQSLFKWILALLVAPASKFFVEKLQ